MEFKIEDREIIYDFFNFRESVEMEIDADNSIQKGLISYNPIELPRPLGKVELNLVRKRNEGIQGMVSIYSEKPDVFLNVDRFLLEGFREENYDFVSTRKELGSGYILSVKDSEKLIGIEEIIGSVVTSELNVRTLGLGMFGSMPRKSEETEKLIEQLQNFTGIYVNACLKKENIRGFENMPLYFCW